MITPHRVSFAPNLSGHGQKTTVGENGGLALYLHPFGLRSALNPFAFKLDSPSMSCFTGVQHGGWLDKGRTLKKCKIVGCRSRNDGAWVLLTGKIVGRRSKNDGALAL